MLLLCSAEVNPTFVFFDCPMARLLWGAVCFTFGVKKPKDVGHLFGPWIRSFSKKQRNLVLVGMAAFYWVLWISRNDLMFNKTQYKSIL
jgi:hypothetical protein